MAGLLICINKINKNVKNYHKMIAKYLSIL